MKFLFLIHLNEKELDAMPAEEMNSLNARHLEFNNSLRKSGHFIEAEALEPSAATAWVRVRKGKTTTVVDGPFAESKEIIAGFYLIDAADLREATQIASKIPSAPLGTIEVRPARKLIVDGIPRDA